MLGLAIIMDMAGASKERGRACKCKNARLHGEASIFKWLEEVQALAAARLTLLDGLAKQAAANCAKQGAKRAVATRIDCATGQSASTRADDQARGAIIALAAITTIIVAPHAIIAGHDTTVTITVPVAIFPMIAAVMAIVPISHRRRNWKGECRRKSGENELLH